MAYVKLMTALGPVCCGESKRREALRTDSHVVGSYSLPGPGND